MLEDELDGGIVDHHTFGDELLPLDGGPADVGISLLFEAELHVVGRGLDTVVPEDVIPQVEGEFQVVLGKFPRSGQRGGVGVVGIGARQRQEQPADNLIAATCGGSQVVQGVGVPDGPDDQGIPRVSTAKGAKNSQSMVSSCAKNKKLKEFMDCWKSLSELAFPVLSVKRGSLERIFCRPLNCAWTT